MSLVQSTALTSGAPFVSRFSLTYPLPLPTLVATTGEVFEFKEQEFDWHRGFVALHTEWIDLETSTYHMDLCATTLQHFFDRIRSESRSEVRTPWEASDVWELLVKGDSLHRRPDLSRYSKELRTLARTTCSRSSLPDDLDVHMKNFVFHHTLYCTWDDMRQETEDRLRKMIRMGTLHFDQIDEHVRVAIGWQVPNTRALAEAMDALRRFDLWHSSKRLSEAVAEEARNARARESARLEDAAGDASEEVVVVEEGAFFAQTEAASPVVV